MGSRYNSTKRLLTLVVMLLLILTFSLVFGQVLGSLYLDNLAVNSEQTVVVDPPKASKGKTNVLRLNVITYYTIEVASNQEREKAVQIGNILAEQGLPVIITGTAPYRVMLGFLNQREKLMPLAQTITVDGKQAQVLEESINSVAYKFHQGDVLATERIAPYLGQVSLALEKATLLNSELECTLNDFGQTKPKFLELAEDITGLTTEGQKITELLQEEDPQQAAHFHALVSALAKLASSLQELSTTWTDQQLLVSQQHILAVIEDYQGFLLMTN